MVWHLLDLPREIRNMIYKYTLTEDDGVCYREDKNGIGWLCRYRAREEDLNPTGGTGDGDQTGEQVCDDNDDKSEKLDRDVYAGQDRETATRLGRSNSNSMQDRETGRAPKQPPEAESGKDHLQILGGIDIIANQIQFVCHQLASEAKGLSLHYNTMWFLDHNLLNEQFDKFVHSLTSKQKSSLKIIAIKDQKGKVVLASSSILPFCRDNPNVFVHWYRLTNGSNALSLLLTVLYYEIIFGEYHPLMVKFNGRIRQRLVDLTVRKGHLPRNHDCPANFRIFVGYKPLNETEFRKSAMKCRIVRDTIIPGVPGGLDSLLELAKDVANNGI